MLDRVCNVIACVLGNVDPGDPPGMYRPGRTKRPGIIWRWDRADYLTVEEYDHWMDRKLPWGWGIIRAPEER